MQQAYILTGSMTDERTVTLDEALPIKEGKVRVVVEVITTAPRLSYTEVMDMIRARQQERGFVPPTREDLDAYLEAERQSWDE